MLKESVHEGLEKHDEITIGKHGVLTVGGARAVTLTQEAYAFMMQVLHEHAPHAIKYAFYDMGYQVGRQLMAATMTEDRDPENGFRLLVNSYKQLGYGDLQVDHFNMDGPEAHLSGINLFETGVAQISGVYRTPRCVDHYSRGMFAGFLSDLLKREVVCEEVACTYRGDPRCEFVVLPYER
ncbi:MAG TPA: 4-vinyl reductase [Chloroflexota bacterium]|nr:4-vinyl reductase [Chloroflexota bacterium]